MLQLISHSLELLLQIDPGALEDMWKYVFLIDFKWIYGLSSDDAAGFVLELLPEVGFTEQRRHSRGQGQLL